MRFPPDVPLKGSHLLAFFMAASLLFTVVRWQPEPFIRGKIDAYAAVSGLSLSYSALEVSGLSVRLRDVSLSRSGVAVQVDSFRCSPAWQQILGGEWAFNIDASYGDLEAAAVVGMADRQVEVKAVTAVFDAAMISDFVKFPVPVRLYGIVKLRGEAVFDLDRGLPQSGAIDVSWSDAEIEGMGGQLAAGNYKGRLESGASGWLWSLSGGETLVVDGKGSLTPVRAPLQRWSVAGSLHATNHSDHLMFSALLPKDDQLAFSVAGAVGAPRIKIVSSKGAEKAGSLSDYGNS